MWKAVLEEVARARGGRDSCHAVTNASLCEWTLRDEEWWGWVRRMGWCVRWGWGRGARSLHSCHRPVTQDVISPPPLVWIMGFWSVWALATHLCSDSWTPAITSQ